MCRTTVSIDGFIEEDRGRYLWFHRRTPTREQDTCRTTTPINGFIEGRQGGLEQGTPHAQRDMHGISPAISRREGVASIYFFPHQIVKKLLDSGVCTLSDSELIPLITQLVAMWSNCTT